jgi:HD superfamily phosphohydrolase
MPIVLIIEAELTIKIYSEIMDPIHGYIPFTEIEKTVIDTEPVQRLHRVKQLGMAFYTYPSGVHTRFSHVTGAMHLAGLAAEKMVKQGLLEDDDWQVLRLSALLHDLGHGPFSHSFENLLKKVTGLTHEDMSTKLINETEVGDIIQAAGYSKDLVSRLAVGKTSYKNRKFPAEIIAGQVDMDKMDFLNRDSYFTGVPYGRVDHRRLIEGLNVQDDKLTINSNALYALEQFIIARYEMFKAVYYHRTVRASEAMLDRVLKGFSDEIGFTSSISTEEFLKLDDGYLWSKLNEISKDRIIGDDKRAAFELFSMLKKRTLLKTCYEIVKHEADPQGRILENDKVVEALINSISEEAGVDPLYVIIDTPTLPTIPLNPIKRDNFEIIVYDEKSKKTLNLSKVSPLSNALSQYMEVIRVYSLPNLRQKVSAAASKIFQSELIAEKVSY